MSGSAQRLLLLNERANRAVESGKTGLENLEGLVDRVVDLFVTRWVPAPQEMNALLRCSAGKKWMKVRALHREDMGR